MIAPPHNVARAIDTIRQIAVLAEYGTTGPTGRAPCQSRALSARAATELRAAVSSLAREAIAKLEGIP